ncbi:MAG: hypothetical protein E7045_06065 [Lentisphaerae bacterium]|nr:hypothetical protein [Lentisphaerota bacterium]
MRSAKDNGSEECREGIFSSLGEDFYSIPAWMKILIFALCVYAGWCVYCDYFNVKQSRDIFAYEVEFAYPPELGKTFADEIRKINKSSELKALRSQKVFSAQFIESISKKEPESLLELAKFCKGDSRFSRHYADLLLLSAAYGNIEALNTYVAEVKGDSGKLMKLIDGRMEQKKNNKTEFSDDEKKVYNKIAETIYLELDAVRQLDMLKRNLIEKYPDAFFISVVQKRCKKTSITHPEKISANALSLISIKNLSNKSFVCSTFDIYSEKGKRLRFIYDTCQEIAGARQELKKLKAGKSGGTGAPDIDLMEKEGELSIVIMNGKKAINGRLRDVFWYRSYYGWHNGRRQYSWSCSYSGKTVSARSIAELHSKPGKYWVLGYSGDYKSCFIKYVDISEDSTQKVLTLKAEDVITF